MRIFIGAVTVLFLGVLTACETDEKLVPTSMKGEISGTLTDGTPFNESFEFNQPPTEIEKFEDYANGKYLELIRQNGPSYLRIGVVLEDPGLPAEKLVFFDDHDYARVELSFFFQKETSPSTLIEIASEGFQTSIFFRSMSIAANEVYKLVVDADHKPIIFGTSRQYYQPPLGGEGYFISEFIFKNAQGDLIYFSGDEGSGQYFFKKILYATGGESTSDPVYEELRYFRIAHVASEQFRKVPSAGMEIPFWEEYTKTDGTGSVTNHTFDQSTGHLTFDFNINISSSNPTNSTGHDLTITGTFDSGDRKIFLNTKN